MNRLFLLPVDILKKIYDYDDTYRNIFKKQVLNNNDDEHKFYRNVMEKKFVKNNHGTVLSIINHQYFNCFERVICDDEIKKIEYCKIENPLGITIQTYKYLLMTDELPYFMDVPEYICMYSGGITICEFLHKIISIPFFHYYGWIYIYQDWTNDYKNTLCDFVNMSPDDRDDNFKFKDYSLKVFLENNSHYISNCKMAKMYFKGCDISLYQTDGELYISIDDNEMSMTEDEKEWYFNKIITEINRLLNI